MADYISREAALELIDNAPIIAGSENETLISAPELSDKVYCLPAADVVEVVRCKDCTYFNHVKCQEKRAGLCEHFSTYMYISDYCSDGERRADNG